MRSFLGRMGAVAIASACTMDNPAFGVEAGGDGSTGESESGSASETGEGESGSTGTDTGTSETSATTDSSSSDTLDTGPDESTDGPTQCDYGRTDPLDIRIGKSNPNTPCAGQLQGHFKVKGQVANGFSVEPCLGDGCAECDPNGVTTLTLAPLEPPQIASCLWVVGELLLVDADDACHYAGVSMWDQFEQTETPRIVASTADYGPPGASLNALGGFFPAFKPLYTCECGQVVDVPDCCESEPPMAAKLDIAGMGVVPGDAVPVHLGADNKQFEFFNVQSYRTGVCGDEKQVGWGLLR